MKRTHKLPPSDSRLLQALIDAGGIMTHDEWKMAGRSDSSDRLHRKGFVRRLRGDQRPPFGVELLDAGCDVMGVSRGR